MKSIVKSAAIIILCFFVFHSNATGVNFTSDGTIQEPDEYHGVGIWNIAVVDMFGGIVSGDIGVNNQSVFNLRGGITYEIYDRSIVNITGGEVRSHIRAESGSTVNIYGGTLTCKIDVWGGGTLNIYGGNLNLTGQPPIDTDIYGFGRANIYGYGFNYDSDNYILTGFLKDGNPITMNGLDPFHYSRLNLIPEPCTILLVGLGGMFLRKRKKF